jgi:DNA-binding transcriptional ArsR family regulator
MADIRLPIIISEEQVKALSKLSIFTPDELEVGKTLFKSYTKGTAEALFTTNEIKLIQTLASSIKKRSTSEMAIDAEMDKRTASKGLKSLEEKGYATSEQSGKSVLWSQP